MSRRAARSKLCPTVSKSRYLTEAEAIAAGVRRAAEMQLCHQPATALYVYQCPCLWWHLTRNSHARDGIRHREAVL